MLGKEVALHPEAAALIAAVRARASKLSVVVLAMQDRDEDFLAWTDVGISGYLGPDTSADDLMSTVRRVAAGDVVYPARRTPSQAAGNLLDCGKATCLVPAVPCIDRSPLLPLRGVDKGWTPLDGVQGEPRVGWADCLVQARWSSGQQVSATPGAA